MNRYWLRSLAVLMVLCFAVSFYATAEELDPSQYYYSLDRESKDELPGNIRFVTKGEYELKEQSYRPGRTYTPSYYPKTDGMDTLNISGSQQYAAGQFAKLADRIKELAAREGIEKVIIVDLRQ
ncbi:MAG: hypothetical protein J6S50_08715 [Oscillospiraceae bacterium]|nr:hypothetical protein [Oscillospiraceae bacterium]